MKIGMNVDWDMADGWRVLVLGLSARIARNRARSMRSELCEHRCSLPYTSLKIVINVQWDMADGWRVLVSGSCARSMQNHKACSASLASTVSMFPALYNCENWH